MQVPFQKPHCLCFGTEKGPVLLYSLGELFQGTSVPVFGLDQEPTDSTQWRFSICLWNSNFRISHSIAFNTLGRDTGFDSQNIADSTVKQ